MPTKLTSPVYVVGDNIDTDQIIPAQYLTLVPTIPDEYEKLGSYAMVGLPDDLYPIEFIKTDTTKTDYKIIIAGKNFGCGSSREHAPISLGAAGVEAIVAESYARIFFRVSFAKSTPPSTYWMRTFAPARSLANPFEPRLARSAK